MGRAKRSRSTGLKGTPRVGEIYLPIPHPGDMCSGEKDQQPDQDPTRDAATESIQQVENTYQVLSDQACDVDAVRVVNLLVNLCFAFDWILHRSPQRPFHPAADLRKKSWDFSDSKLWVAQKKVQSENTAKVLKMHQL